MRKTITLIFLTVFFTGTVQAGPVRWVKHQFREHPTRTAIIIGFGAATVNGIGLKHCREDNVENCQAKYGSAWLSFGAVTVTNLAVISATNGCLKEHSVPFCSLFSYGGSAAQAGFGVNQWHLKGKH